MGNIHPCCSGSMRIQLKVLTVVLWCLLLSRRAAAAQFEFKSQSEENRAACRLPCEWWWQLDRHTVCSLSTASCDQSHVIRVNWVWSPAAWRAGGWLDTSLCVSVWTSAALFPEKASGWSPAASPAPPSCPAAPSISPWQTQDRARARERQRVSITAFQFMFEARTWEEPGSNTTWL